MMATSKRSRAVVLLSGGMDSCVCAALAARDHEAAAVHISYGQRTEERERQSFLAICQRLKIHDKLMVRNEALRAIGGSALTDDAIDVPAAEEIGHTCSRHLRSLSQCAFSGRRRELGRGAGRGKGVHWRSRA